MVVLLRFDDLSNDQLRPHLDSLLHLSAKSAENGRRITHPSIDTDQELTGPTGTSTHSLQEAVC